MTRYVAIKWVVEEEGTAEAFAVLGNARLSAPDLLVAECANVLWKKVLRSEISEDEALLSARLLEQRVRKRPLSTRSTFLRAIFGHDIISA